MLDYDFIFKRGILFIRFKGDFTKKTSELLVQEINPLILDNGIKKVVFNVSNLNKVDNDGILAFYDSYLKLSKESDICLCEIPISLRNKFKFLLKYIKEKEDEISCLMRSSPN